MNEFYIYIYIEYLIFSMFGIYFVHSILSILFKKYKFSPPYSILGSSNVFFQIVTKRTPRHTIAAVCHRVLLRSYHWPIPYLKVILIIVIHVSASGNLGGGPEIFRPYGRVRTEIHMKVIFIQIKVTQYSLLITYSTVLYLILLTNTSNNKILLALLYIHISQNLSLKVTNTRFFPNHPSPLTPHSSFRSIPNLVGMEYIIYL